MNYEQKLKWKEMERLLPMLVKSLEKKKEVVQLQTKGVFFDKDGQTKFRELSEELHVEDEYLKKIAQVVKGIKIVKGQITLKEAEALLYFIWLTDTSVTDFFDIDEYVPPVISSRIKKKYNGAEFEHAFFSEIF